MNHPAKASPPTKDERTTAIGLARYALEYAEAADTVDQHMGAKKGYETISPIPAYFLAHHSIELTLKAFLRHKGVSVDDLSKKYGHDIRRCYRKSKELGLLSVFKEHAVDRDTLVLLSGINASHSLRYIQTGAKHFPMWSMVWPTTVRLHRAVAPHVGYNKTLDVAFPEFPGE